MALIKMGSLVTQISGKIGGQTFGTGPAGSYVKNSGTPRKSLTLLQQTKMQRMATSAQAWRQLSTANKTTYISASSSYPYLNRVGDTKYYSGFAIFTKLRNNLFALGGSGTPAPLPLFSFPPLKNVIVATIGGNYSISAEGEDVNATYSLFTSRPGSKGVSNPYKNQFFISIVTSAQLGVGFNFATALASKFGTLAVGSKIFWRLDGIQTTTGQVLKNMSSGFFLTV